LVNENAVAEIHQLFLHKEVFSCYNETTEKSVILNYAHAI
jgi:hypothetical protein